MGVLTAKFDTPISMAKDDIRAAPPGWLKYFKDGRPDPIMAEKVNAIRDLLRSGGRTLAQGALAWNWAQSPPTLPIPGFRTVAQVSENAGALDYGPLSQDVVAEIRQLLSRLVPDLN
jgi:aryl-alcohol dehydrogenase-like predicted oxidoreductase